jgi:hypothetical protein
MPAMPPFDEAVGPATEGQWLPFICSAVTFTLEG